MNSVSKTLTLTLVVLLLSSLLSLSVMPVSVQAVSKPSVPQFSVKLIDNSYHVPPTQTTNSYTGIVTTHPGYQVNDMRIDVSIKNQRFTPYTDTFGRECNLYYRVEVKGHFEEDNWRAFSYQYYNHYADSVSFVSPSGSEYTVVSSETRYDVDSQLDFRVKAFTGYWVEPTMGDHAAGFHDPRLVEAESSSWSSIQTIIIKYGTSSLSPSQTTTLSLPPNSTTTPDNNQPQQPEQTRPSFVFHPLFLPLVVGFLFVGVVVVVVMVFIRRHLKGSTCSDNFTG
jgi:hypothetical protein